MTKFSLKAFALTIAMVSGDIYASGSTLLIGLDDQPEHVLVSEKTHSYGTMSSDNNNLRLVFRNFEEIVIENGMSAFETPLERGAVFYNIRGVKVTESSESSLMIERAEPESIIPTLITTEGKDINIEIVLAAFNQKIKIQNGLYSLTVPFVGMYNSADGNIVISKNEQEEPTSSGTIHSNKQNEIFFELGSSERTIWAQKSEDSQEYYMLKNIELINECEDHMRLKIIDLALLLPTAYGIPAKITHNSQDLFVEIILAAYNQTFKIPYGANILRRFHHE